MCQEEQWYWPRQQGRTLQTPTTCLFLADVKTWAHKGLQRTHGLSEGAALLASYCANNGRQRYRTATAFPPIDQPPLTAIVVAQLTHAMRHADIPTQQHEVSQGSSTPQSSMHEKPQTMRRCQKSGPSTRAAAKHGGQLLLLPLVLLQPRDQALAPGALRAQHSSAQCMAAHHRSEQET
jgi:hypothetical protein